MAALVGQEHRAQEGAAARRTPDHPQGAGVAAEDVPGEHRQQHRVGRRGEVDHRQGEDQGAHRPGVAHVGHPLLEYLAHRAAGPRGRAALDAQQADHEGHEGQTVDRKAQGLGGEPEQQARQRRPDEAAGVEEHGVEGQGVGKVLDAPDEAVDERLAQGRVEAVEDAQGEGHGDDQAGADQARPGEDGEHEGLQRQQRLHADEPLLLVLAVDPRPGQRPHHELRDERAEGRHPQERRRAGEPIDQPRKGHLLDPRAQDGHRLPGKIEAEVAVGERPQGGRQARGGRGHRGFPGHKAGQSRKSKKPVSVSLTGLCHLIAPRRRHGPPRRTGS